MLCHSKEYWTGLAPGVCSRLNWQDADDEAPDANAPESNWTRAKETQGVEGATRRSKRGQDSAPFPSLTKYEFSVNGRRHQRWRAFSKHVKKRNCSQYWNAEALCFSDVNLIKAIWPGQEADNTSNQTKRNFKIKIKPKIKKLNGRMFASWRTVSDGKEWQRWAARNAIQEAATLKRFHREKKNKMIPLTSQWQGSELSKFVTWFWPAFTICFLSVSFAPKSY